MSGRRCLALILLLHRVWLILAHSRGLIYVSFSLRSQFPLQVNVMGDSNCTEWIGVRTEAGAGAEL